MHTHSPEVLLASVTPYEAHIFPSVQNLIINLVTLIIFFIFIHITDTLSSIPCQYTEPGAPWDYPITLFTLCPFSHVPRPNHFLSKWYVHAQARSHVWLSVILWTAACQAPLPTRFSEQEYWSGLPCPPPGNLPDPGIKPISPESPALAGRFSTTALCREPQ